MKLLKYIFIVLFFSSCVNKDRKHPRIYTSESMKPIEVNTKIMLRFASIYPLAINFDKDTILGKEVDLKSLDKNSITLKNIDTILPRYNLKIIVDTSYFVSLKGFEYKSISLPEGKNLIIDGKIDNKIPNACQISEANKICARYFNKTFAMQKDYINCYPLLIFNNGSNYAYFKEIKFIQEAQDSDGNWKPIEFFRENPTCIVDNVFFKFQPKKYQASAVVKYHGNFKTKLRVKVKINNEIYYSNAFYGFINKSQFNKDYALKYIKFMTPFRDNSYLQEYEKFVFLE